MTRLGWYRDHSKWAVTLPDAIKVYFLLAFTIFRLECQGLPCTLLASCFIWTKLKAETISSAGGPLKVFVLRFAF